MDESLKDEAKRYASQQHSLFGDIVITKREKKAQLTQQQVKNPKGSPVESASLLAQEISGIAEDWVGASSLASLNQMICACVKCPLGHSRNKFVFGVGNPDADIVVIGEGPGADED